jgi:hypothetical protein
MKSDDRLALGRDLPGVETDGGCSHIMQDPGLLKHIISSNANLTKERIKKRQPM